MTRRVSVAQRLTPAVPWPEAGTVDAHVRAEQVRIVYGQAPMAQTLSIAAAGVVSAVIWPVGDHVLIGAWFGAITALTLGRIGLTVQFRRRRPRPEAMPTWEIVFVSTLGLVSLVWGLGGWFVMPDSLVHKAVVYFFLMGMGGGAVASYGAHPGASAASVMALMVPATIGFALQDVWILRAMAAGGLLYLAAALRSTRSVGFFLRRTFELSYELHQAYARAQDQARTDELTRLPNRRAFVEQATAAFQLAERHDRPLALIMFDIDHFKQVNDTHGHAAGDEALREVAAAVRRTARVSDVPGRLGGEEFGLLLPETGVDEAVRVAERIRQEVGASSVEADGTAFAVTCSCGVAGRSPDTDDLDALMRVADEALYRAKKNGRDRVVRQR